MSIKLVVEVLDNAPVRGSALVFLIALADQADDDDRCAWPGAKQLARRTRCNSRTVYRLAEALQRQNIIERVDTGDRPDRYRRKSGRETTVWRIKPQSSWLTDPDDPVVMPEQDAPEGGVTEDQIWHEDQTTSGVGTTPGLAVVSIEPSENPQETPLRKNRRAKARQGEDDLPVIGGLPAEQPVRRAKRTAPVRVTNPAGLAKHFDTLASAKAFGDPRGATHQAALARNLTRLRDDKGIPMEQLAACVELFFASEHYWRPGAPFWKTFLSNVNAMLTSVVPAPEADPEVVDMHRRAAAAGLAQLKALGKRASA